MRKSTTTLLVALLASAAGACADAATAPDSPLVSVEIAEPNLTATTGPGDGGTCDPWLDLNFCKGHDNPGGTCEESVPGSEESAGVESCLPFFGSPPPHQPAPDTCLTNDPILDDANVKAALSELWQASNPEANLAQRVETGGWIVQEADGLRRIERWTVGSANFACGRFEVRPPQTGTVVGFVHTHPYSVGEAVVNCEWQITTYNGTPSDEDRVASVQLGGIFGRTSPLPGYILDKDGTYRFVGQAYTATPRGPRCDY